MDSAVRHCQPVKRDRRDGESCRRVEEARNRVVSERERVVVAHEANTRREGMNDKRAGTSEIDKLREACLVEESVKGMIC